MIALLLLIFIAMPCWAEEQPSTSAPMPVAATATAPAAPDASTGPSVVPGSTQDIAYDGNGGYEALQVIDQEVSEADLARRKHRQTLAQAFFEMRARKFADATKTLEASLVAYPTSVVALTALAEICYEDNTPRAQEHLDKAMKIDPDYYRAHYVQGLVHKKLGKNEPMLESLNRCLELSPEQTNPRQMRAEYLQQRVDSPELLRKAIEDLQFLQQAVPQQSLVWNFYIGRCYFHLKEFGKAQKYLEPLIATPLGPQASYILGLCKQELGDYAQAIEYLDRIKGNPLADENLARIAMIQAESSTGEVRLKYKTQALEELTSLLKNPSFRPRPEHYLMTGRLALELGLPNIAVDCFENYLKRNPKDEEAKVFLLTAELANADPDSFNKVKDHYSAFLSTKSATETVVVRRAFLEYLVKIKRWDAIPGELQALRGLTGDDSALAIMEAQVEFGQENYPAAINAASRAIKLGAKNRNVIEKLIGLCYLKQKMPQDAAAWFEKSIASTTDTMKALVCLEIGNHYQDENMNKERLEYWNRALEYHPANHQLRYEMAMAYLRSGSDEIADPMFEKVSKEADEDLLKSQAFTLRAYIAIVRGATQSAEACYKSAIEVWPSNLPAQRGYANLLSDLERYEEAREHYNLAVAQDPKDATLHVQLGIVCDKLNDIEGAEKAAEGAMNADPQYSEGYNFLGYLYAERGIKLDRAEELILKALELDPESPNINDSLGWVYFQRGEYAKAVEVLEKAVSLLTEEYMNGASVIFEHLGDAYEKVGSLDKAREMWRKATETEPKSQTAAEKLEKNSSPENK